MSTKTFRRGLSGLLVMSMLAHELLFVMPIFAYATEVEAPVDSEITQEETVPAETETPQGQVEQEIEESPTSETPDPDNQEDLSQDSTVPTDSTDTEDVSEENNSTDEVVEETVQVDEITVSDSEADKKATLSEIVGEDPELPERKWILQDGFWKLNSTIEVGTRYTHPEIPGFAITFSRVSGDEPVFSIRSKTVNLNGEQLKGVEIISNMENGTFTYDLELPVRHSSEVDQQIVKYTENGYEYKVITEVESDGMTHVMRDLDHFTTFIVVDPNPVPDGDPCSVSVGSGTCYTSIQDAIDAAVAGDTVLVSDGVYAESFVINKSLTLIGESKAGTVIDVGNIASGVCSPQSAVCITADNVVLRNLTVTRVNPLDTSPIDRGVKVAYANNVTIENVDVVNTEGVGFDIINVQDIDLSSVSSTDNAKAGIFYKNVIGSTITDITLGSNGWGDMGISTDCNYSPVPCETSGIEFYGANTISYIWVEVNNSSDPAYMPTIGFDSASDVDLTNTGFTHVVIGENNGTAFQQVALFKNYSDAESFALNSTPPHYVDETKFIYDVVQDEYYVVTALSLQAAINAADAGDTVNIVSGVYNFSGRAAMVGKTLNLNCEVGAVLSGDGTSRGVVINSNDVTLQNCEITNFRNGVFIRTGVTDGQSVEIDNNLIYGNVRADLSNDQGGDTVEASYNGWTGGVEPTIDPAGNIIGDVVVCSWITNADLVNPTYDGTCLGQIQGRTFVDITNVDSPAPGLLLNSDGDHPSLMMDGFTVRLYDATWNMLGEQTTRTTANVGQYSFTGLSADGDMYYVCGVDNAEYAHSPALVGQNVVDTANNSAAGMVTANGTVAPASIVANGSSAGDESPVCWSTTLTATNDLGAYLGVGYAKDIFGTKYEDIDANGYHLGQPAEPRLDGWIINLYADNAGTWELYDSQVTGDVAGSRVNFKVPEGTYYYCEESQPGWVATYPANAGDELLYNENQNNQPIPEYQGIVQAVANSSDNAANEAPLCWEVQVDSADARAAYGWLKFGNHELETPSTPTQTGYNENDENDASTYPTPRNPNELTCTGDYTSINGVSVHWTDESTGNPFYDDMLMYERQYNTGGAWRGSEDYSNPYSNYRTFGGATGNEGTYGSQVRAYYDLNGNQQYDSGEPVSDWSNECSITYDTTPPAVPQNLHRVDPATGDVIACGAVVPRMTLWPTWDANMEADFSHYEYSSFNPSAQGINEQVMTAEQFQHNWTPPQDGTYGYVVRAVDNAGNKSDWALVDESLGGSCQITYDSTAPTVEVLEDATFVEGQSVTLNAPESEDANQTYLYVEYTYDDPLNGTTYGPQMIVNGEMMDEVSTGLWDLPDVNEMIDTSITNLGSEGTYTVNYWTEDEAGNLSDEESVTYTVENVAPQVTFGTSTTIDEGNVVTFNGSFTDPSSLGGSMDGYDDGPWRVRIDYGEGDGFEVVEAAMTEPGVISGLENEYIFDGIYTVTLEVCEYDDTAESSRKSENECSTETVEVTVENVPPTVSIEADPGLTVNEGDVISLLAIGEEGNDPLTYQWSGDCTGSDSATTLAENDGTYECTVTVTDVDGDTAQATVTLTVNNIVPTVNITANPGNTVLAGTTVTLTANAGSGNTPLVYLWSGDCSGTAANANVPNVAGTYNCTVTVTDVDGDTATASQTVVVNNPVVVVPPAVPFPAAVDEGDVEGVQDQAEADDEGDVLGALTCEDEDLRDLDGRIYVDENNNEKYDDGEKLLKDVDAEITYVDEDGEIVIVSTQTSDRDGEWEIELCAGTYTVELMKDSLDEMYMIDSNSVEITLLDDTSVEFGVDEVDTDESEDSDFNWWYVIVPLILLLLLIAGLGYKKYRDEKTASEQVGSAS